MILIYKQSSEPLIFYVLLNRGPTFTFKTTCGKRKKKWKYVQKLFLYFMAFQHFSCHFRRG